MTFQVHQVKKSKKWACKVCGEKQSVKKVYAQGSGLDCRKHVQKLNMKCGEAQKAENLAYGSTESADFCKCSEKTNIIGSVDNSQITNHGDNTGLSKWEKFLELNSSDDNGLDYFNGFNVTTERDVFDKASSRGKRKWHFGRSSTYPTGKRSKNNNKKEQGSITDTDWLNINNATEKTQHHSQKQFYSDTGMQKPSPYTLGCYDVASKECHYIYPSHSGGVLPYRNLWSNTQTSHAKCNIYFAKATRDPTPLKMSSFVGGTQEKPSLSSSKWAKFMPSPSVQNQSCVTLAENSLSCSVTPDNKYNDNSGRDGDLGEQGSKSQDRQCNSLQVQDLFKVDDDLDEEWWNSM